jgi:hypothetical protein
LFVLAYYLYAKQEKQDKDGYTHDFKGLKTIKIIKRGKKPEGFITDL